MPVTVPALALLHPIEHYYLEYPLRAMSIKGLSSRVEGSTLILSDRLGPKWEIRRITEEVISLYHRSKGQAAFHYQGVTRRASSGGVASVLHYIQGHETYEKENARMGFHKVPRRMRRKEK